MSEGLELAQVNKKIWLVKVPNSVAQAWRPLCEQAMNPDNLEDDDSHVQLGTLRVAQKEIGEGKKTTELTLSVSGPPAPVLPGMPRGLPGSSVQQGGPRQFKLAKLTSGGDGLVVAFSYKTTGPPPPQGEPDQPATMKAEGTVDVSFNATPVMLEDGKGSLHVDAEYCRLSKDRNIKAAVRTRVVRQFEDNRSNHLSVLASKRMAEMDAKRKGEEVRRNREDNKRVRAEAPVLERELFRLFERQSQWTFGQLQKETNQPGPHLKQVLEGIAILNKTGPLKDLYTLKKEYLLGGAAAAGQS